MLSLRVLNPVTGVALLCVIFATFSATDSRACTTMVACGRATADGRPLMWKNRDAPHEHNEVVYFNSEEGHNFIAVVNAGASDKVWMGMNDAGFCIENSLSLDIPGKSVSGPGNGRFMKSALETCATVADFEKLLKATNHIRRTRANFSLIDAHGGAALFEAGPDNYTRFDATDRDATPNGYIVRANFAMTASGDKPTAKLYSSERYLRANELIERAADRGKLSPQLMLRQVARDVIDQRSRPPFLTEVNNGEADHPQFINTTTTINCRTTVSAVVFQGVRPGEDPSLTTMWVILGQPLFSIAVPCWVNAGEVSAALDGPDRSPLNSAAVELRNSYYDAAHNNLNTAALPGLLKTTLAAEDRILDLTHQQLANWRQRSPEVREMSQWHRDMASQAIRCLDSVRSDRHDMSAVHESRE